MGVIVGRKNGRNIVLLNPAEKSVKFATEIKTGIRRTNEGEYKIGSDKKAMRLTKSQKSFRAGYLSARSDNAKCYKSTKKKFR